MIEKVQVRAKETLTAYGAKVGDVLDVAPGEAQQLLLLGRVEKVAKVKRQPAPVASKSTGDKA